MVEQFESMPLPPGMYRGGFESSSRAVRLALAHYGLEPPLSLYYPGSSTDVSLVGIEGVDTIHADMALGDEDLRGFGVLGAEAHSVDVLTWIPPQQVDIITFINPSGIDELSVLRNVQIRKSGLIIWASWSGLPKNLEESEATELVGVINVNDDELSIDTEELGSYFIDKAYDELEETEKQDFSERMMRYLSQNNLKTDLPEEEVYTELQLSENSSLVSAINFQFPKRKKGIYFVYKA